MGCSIHVFAVPQNESIMVTVLKGSHVVDSDGRLWRKVWWDAMRRYCVGSPTSIVFEEIYDTIAYDSYTYYLE